MRKIATVASGHGAGKIFVVSGPSGAGKTSLCKVLLEGLPSIVGSISHTTRPPREGEEGGKDYYFVDSGTFERMIQEGVFLEWAEVHGYKYGTLERNVRERQAGLDLLFEVDCKGAAQIKEKLADAILVFIMPPSIEDLVKRILKRGPISDADLVRRMESARDEIQRLDCYDYLLVNEGFSEAFEQLRSIVVAERSRREVQAASWREKWMQEISSFGVSKRSPAL